MDLERVHLALVHGARWHSDRRTVSVAHYIAYLYSLSIGLMLGIERERSNRAEPHQAFGIRTFALVALLGTLAISISVAIVVVAMAALSGLIVIAYLRASRRDQGTTTDVAVMAAFLLGVLCYRDAALAAGLAIVITVLLMSRIRLHTFVREVLGESEIEDALKFLVIALVVLPLLPNRGVGPYGVLNPSRMWLIVVALTGISWLGYIAVRALGPRRGLVTAGLASGFVSASAVTAAMGHRSRSRGMIETSVAAAQIANVATFVQLEIILLVVSPVLALRLAIPSLLGSLVMSGVAIHEFRSSRLEGKSDEQSVIVTREPGERVFNLLPALVLAAILTCALLVGRWGEAVFGAKGVILTAGAAGLADAHGGSLAAATLFAKGSLGLASSLFAIGAALLANSMVKSIIAFSTGGWRFGRLYTFGLAPSLVVFEVALVAAAQVN